MATGRAVGAEADTFEPIRNRLEAWRATRDAGSCIPEELWQPATKLAVEHGVSRTSRELRLGYRELKARVENSKDAATVTRRSGRREGGFVELPSAGGLLGGPECLIEVENGRTRIRIALNGRGTSAVGAVIDALAKRGRSYDPGDAADAGAGSD